MKKSKSESINEIYKKKSILSAYRKRESMIAEKIQTSLTFYVVVIARKRVRRKDVKSSKTAGVSLRKSVPISNVSNTVND